MVAEAQPCNAHPGTIAGVYMPCPGGVFFYNRLSFTVPEVFSDPAFRLWLNGKEIFGAPFKERIEAKEEEERRKFYEAWEEASDPMEW